MAAFLDRLDGAAVEATCQLLNKAGESLVGYGAVSWAVGATGPVPLAFGAAALLASRTACNWDPNQSSGQNGPTTGHCVELTGGGGTLAQKELSEQTWTGFGPGGDTVVSMSVQEVSGIHKYNYVITYIRTIGDTGEIAAYSNNEPKEFKIIPGPGATCSRTGPSEFPTIPDHTYTDVDSGCEINVKFLGIGTDETGRISPIWEMSPTPTDGGNPAARNTGDIISNCNFAPIIWYEPGGDAPVVIPKPDCPDGEEDCWIDAIAGAMHGAARVAADQALNEFFGSGYGATEYTMSAACNYKEDGTPEEFTVSLPPQTFAQRALSLGTTQFAFLQQHLKWKTPTCSGGGQSVSGDPVSINWVSDEYSLAGNDRIRKLLTYFDQNNTTLEATVDHWKDFSFEAGPVIVSCVGTPLGKPQVWASSVDEAKRVISHAAAIAGVDLTDAEWMTGSPKSGRYGQTATMRVSKNHEGYFSITKRPGPSGPTERLKLIPTPGSG